MSADLRERVARAIAREFAIEAVWDSFRAEADAVLAELAPELQPQAEPVGEWVMVPRERVQHACDLLAERTYGSKARSPGHNARLVLEAMLAAPKPLPRANLNEPFGTAEQLPQAAVPRTVAVDVAREAMRVGNLYGHVRTVEGCWSEEIDERFADFMGEYAAPQPQPAPEGWPAGRAARAVWDAATQPQPQAEPVGEWVMVPREPTEARLAACVAIVLQECGETAASVGSIAFEHLMAVQRRVYESLLADAPQPQASAEDYFEAALIDLDLLHKALSKSDPKAELLIRVEDLQRRIRASLEVGRG
jgi:hypothetical protein